MALNIGPSIRWGARFNPIVEHSRDVGVARHATAGDSPLARHLSIEIALPWVAGLYAKQFGVFGRRSSDGRVELGARPQRHSPGVRRVAELHASAAHERRSRARREGGIGVVGG